MVGRSSLCLYVRIGSYTLGSSCVQVYIQSHVRKDQGGGSLSKQVRTLTGGVTTPNWDLTEGKKNLIWNRSTQQVEDSKSPEEEPSLSFAIPLKKREQKRGEEDRNGRNKTKRLSSAQQNGLSFGRLACNIVSQHLVKGGKKKKKLKKGLPSKDTSVLYISTHHF